MSEYWFVIKPTNEALYEALRTVLMGRPGFHIIKDRRTQSGQAPVGHERRTARTWAADDISIAHREPHGR